MYRGLLLAGTKLVNLYWERWSIDVEDRTHPVLAVATIKAR